MKYQIMIDMLFMLLAKRKVSATRLAQHFGISVRTVYRYVDEMTVAGIPIDVARGAGGGIYISDSYKLPKGMLTRDEYGRVLDAIAAMHEQTGDAVLSSAREKLTAQMKAEKFDTTISGTYLVDYGTWGDERKFSEKLTLLARAIEECEALDIDYIDRTGGHTRRTVLPHLLIYKQNIWYVWAFCLKRNGFRTFKLGRMRSIIRTGESFERKEFSRDEIPLTFWRDSEESVEVLFRIANESIIFVEEWLGIENVYKEGDTYYAKVSLPDDESLLGTILSAGSGLEVLEPLDLRERVKKEAEKFAAAYK